LSIAVHGDGSQERTLTYIDDFVAGIISPLENAENAKGQIFNLSHKNIISALQMAKDVKGITNSSSEIIFVEQRNNQTLYEDIDVSKSKEILKWKAETSWKDGLLKTYS